jgi:hypothetical protein
MVGLFADLCSLESFLALDKLLIEIRRPARGTPQCPHLAAAAAAAALANSLLEHMCVIPSSCAAAAFAARCCAAAAPLPA